MSVERDRIISRAHTLNVYWNVRIISSSCDPMSLGYGVAIWLRALEGTQVPIWSWGYLVFSIFSIVDLTFSINISFTIIFLWGQGRPWPINVSFTISFTIIFLYILFVEINTILQRYSRGNLIWVCKHVVY